MRDEGRGGSACFYRIGRIRRCRGSAPSAMHPASGLKEPDEWGRAIRVCEK